MTDHAREIAELMGQHHWCYDYIDYRQSTPYLDNHQHRGEIEGWCRERGVWVTLVVAPDLDNDAVYRLQNLNEGGFVHYYKTYPEALLAAVRVAKEANETA